MQHRYSHCFGRCVILNLNFLTLKVLHFSHVVHTGFLGQELIILKNSSGAPSSFKTQSDTLLVVKMLCLRNISKHVIVVAEQVIYFELLFKIFNHPGVFYALHQEFETVRKELGLETNFRHTDQ